MLIVAAVDAAYADPVEWDLDNRAMNARGKSGCWGVASSLKLTNDKAAFNEVEGDR